MLLILETFYFFLFTCIFQLGSGWYYSRYNFWEDNWVYIQPALGISYWITEKVAIDMKVGYEINPSNALFSFNEWDMNLGFSLKLGK